MVFQRPNPFPQSIYDNVAFGPRVCRHGQARRRAGPYRAGEPGRAPRCGTRSSIACAIRRSDLNPGQQQRLCIARTIAVKPEVILMDEPCSALDPVATLSVEELMRRLAERIHHCDRHAQHAAGRARLRLHRLLLAGRAGRVQRNGNACSAPPRMPLTEAYITGRRWIGETHDRRAHFERKLNELRDEILLMGSLVEEELKLALEAFDELDADKAKEVSAADSVRQPGRASTSRRSASRSSSRSSRPPAICAPSSRP